jgi:hypothetical protein
VYTDSLSFFISLTNLYRTGVFSEPFNEIILVVLPALVKLLQDPTDDVQERAPLVLADLVKDSEEMQKAAFDADAIPRLAELLASVSSKDVEEEQVSLLGVPGIGSVAKRKEKIKEVGLLLEVDFCLDILAKATCVNVC